MRFAALFSIAFSCSAGFADPVEEHECLYGYLDGRYIAIGKSLETDRTYQGRVILVDKGGYLEVIRKIDGKSVTGRGSIEHALGRGQANVLRVRFADDGKQFEATYLWTGDLDNYARLSGYWYQPGQRTNSPGMEVLFIDHTAR